MAGIIGLASHDLLKQVVLINTSNLMQMQASSPISNALFARSCRPTWACKLNSKFNRKVTKYFLSALKSLASKRMLCVWLIKKSFDLQQECNLGKYALTPVAWISPTVSSLDLLWAGAPSNYHFPRLSGCATSKSSHFGVERGWLVFHRLVESLRSNFLTNKSGVSYDRTDGVTERVRKLFKKYFLAEEHIDCLRKEWHEAVSPTRVRVRRVLPSQGQIICCIDDASLTSEDEDWREHSMQ